MAEHTIAVLIGVIEAWFVMVCGSVTLALALVGLKRVATLLHQ